MKENTKKELLDYSDSELSTWVDNNEDLYKEFNLAVRRDSFDDFVEILREIFIFNNDQLEDLKEKFNFEREEYLQD